MLVHVVLFKYKADTTPASREDHRARLATLSTLDVVQDLKVGADLVGSERSYDTGLVVMLRDLAALAVYRDHPQHVPVAQFGAGLCQSIVAADFEV